MVFASGARIAAIGLAIGIAGALALTQVLSGLLFGVSARDPLTGAVKWSVDYPQPPLASLLSTKGNLLFVPDARGWLRALDAENGKELWSHNNGQGHAGGIISYMAGGKQYVAVPAGWGSLVGDEFAALFGEPFKSMPKNTGALVVFALRQ